MKPKNAYGDTLSRWDAPAANTSRRKAKSSIGYIVFYKRSEDGRPEGSISRRVYTQKAADAIVRRLLRRGVDAYTSPLQTSRKLKKIATRARRSR